MTIAAGTSTNIVVKNANNKSAVWGAASSKSSVATVSLNPKTAANSVTATITAGSTTGDAKISVTNDYHIETINVTVVPAKETVTLDAVSVPSDETETVTADCTDTGTTKVSYNPTGVATATATLDGSKISIVVTPTKVGSTTVTIETAKYVFTLPVTVTKATDKWTFKDKTIQTFGAVKLSQTDNELVLAWKSDTGTLMLPDVAIADILVVGGGGGGGGAQRSSTGSSYWGDAGSGGAVDERMSVEIGAEGMETSFAIKVGAGGTSGTGGTSSARGTDGGKGETSSLSGNGLTIPAEGGVGGKSRKNKDSSFDQKNTSNPGTGSNYVSRITGKTYSVPGKTVTQAGQGSAQAATANTGNGGDAASDPNAEGVSKGGTGGSGYVVVRITDWKTAREPVAVPTAVTGLVYDYTEKTGVVAQTGYTLTGNTATNAGSYKATATLDEGYCWADDSSTTNKFIPWSIARAQATVTVVSTNKLVGAEEPEFQTTTTGFIAEDPTELTWTVWRTNTSDEVGTYDVLVAGEEQQGGYQISYNKGTLTIEAGVVTVNGKGYATVEEAFAALVLAAKSGTATATFNEAVSFQGYAFAKDAELMIAEGGIWMVTGDVTMPGVEKEKTVTVVDSTLTLGGDIYVGDRADWPTEVTSSNVVLGANVTVGAATEGFEPAGIATLAFDEIDVDDYKLTLTTNGVVQSATKLTIEDVFTEVEHFHVAEKAIAGGFEYTLEATEFYVKYYDGDEVVHSNKFTILNYMTDLHIWNGDRKGLVLLGYKKENGEALEQSDAALHAYIKDEADKPGCDGEVKVFGTWEKPTITIHIVQGEGIFAVKDKDGESVNEDLELSAETTEVELTLEADDLTVPVFKVVRGNVTNVTTKVETYAIADGDTLEFFAEEAEWTDPDVTDDDIKTALIESIDDDDPDTREAAEKKVNDVVGTDANQVSARDLATYITDKRIQSSEIVDCDYVAASVNLDTSAPITDAAEVKFVEVEEDTSTGFTFDFELKLSGEETPEELEVEAAKLAGYIQTTGDLGMDFEVIGDTKRVMIDPDTGKVTITPDPTKSAEFFKIVIPKDPGAK